MEGLAGLPSGREGECRRRHAADLGESGESGVVGEGGDEFCRIHTLETLIGDERRWEPASALGREEAGGDLGGVLPASGERGRQLLPKSEFWEKKREPGVELGRTKERTQHHTGQS